MSQANDSLDLLLRQALEPLKTIPFRDATAAARGRANFLAQAKSLQQAVSPAANWRLTGWFNSFLRPTSLATRAAVLLIGGLLAVSAWTTVYAAQDSLPDTPLYPVKILSEDIQIALTFQPESKLSLLLSYTDRRVNELASLARLGIPPPDAVTNRLGEQLDATIELGVNAPDPALAQILEQIQMTVQQQVQTLSLAKSQTVEPMQSSLNQAQEILEERRRLIEIGLTDPANFRIKMAGSGKPVSTREPGRLSVTPVRVDLNPAATETTQEYLPTVTPAVHIVSSTATPAEQQIRSTTTPEPLSSTATPVEQLVHPTATVLKNTLPTSTPLPVNTAPRPANTAPPPVTTAPRPANTVPPPANTRRP